MDDKIEVSWIAGFLDGEGSIAVKSTYPCSALNLAAGQKRREPLERVKVRFGGEIYGPHNNQYQWILSRAPKIVTCIETILPDITHPGFKRQLIISLEIAKLITPGGKPLTEKQQLLRWRLTELLLQEKARGK